MINIEHPCGYPDWFDEREWNLIDALRYLKHLELGGWNEMRRRLRTENHIEYPVSNAIRSFLEAKYG